MNIKRFHPGEYLKDYLECDEKNITLTEFSKDTGIKKDDLKKILNCKKDIDEEIAQKLSDYFGTSKQLWINLQKSFNEYR